MEKGEISNERDDVSKNINFFKSYKDLPLVSSGCDSYASWDTRFKHLSPVLSTDTLASSIAELLPNEEWREEHLVITGGEPLLGWQKAYPDLLEKPLMRNLKELTFETNGTQMLTEEFESYLFEEWTRFGRDYDDLTFSVSPKLSISGEKREEALKPEVINQYQNVGYTYLKFVIAKEADLNEAEEWIAEYKAAGFSGPVYFMPVGGVEDVYKLNNKTVAELALKRGYRYSDRLQIPLFKNAWGT
jgi:organic radical activating enzyme